MTVAKINRWTARKILAGKYDWVRTASLNSPFFDWDRLSNAFFQLTSIKVRFTVNAVWCYPFWRGTIRIIEIT